jgi:type II secretory pathway component PulL
MNPVIRRAMIIFFGAFLAISALTLAYQWLWLNPANRCEETKAWWDPATRVCAQPIYVPDVTGRPAGVSRREWSERQAAEVTNAREAARQKHAAEVGRRYDEAVQARNAAIDAAQAKAGGPAAK